MNKPSLEILLEEMNEIECEFVTPSKIPGMPSPETIYKNQGFLLWRSKVISELKDDTERISQNIIKELSLFNGWRDKKLFNNIKAELTVLVENQRKKEATLMSTSNPNIVEEKPHKLFISHSSKDAEYMKALVEMLEDIGMPEGSFVCTSIPGYGIPGENDIYNWLREQFVGYDLRVLFALSHNYYSSPACLNEMGAAWITKAEDTLLLLPRFGFGEIKGCVDSRKIGISFDSSDDELKHRLNEFKEKLVSEHNLQNITQTRWERHRDKFIQSVREIAERKKEEKALTKTKSDDYTPVVGEDDVGFISVDSAFLLVYAAAYEGQIMKISDINGAVPFITVNGKQFMADLSHRESARWQDALNRLIKWGWVKQCDNSNEMFELTGVGYNKADMLKEEMSIDTFKEPLDEIKELDICGYE